MSSLTPPVYAIPGLGTDLRIFSRFQHLTYTGLEWIEPLDQESLPDYAQRMAEAIFHKEPILIGVSFGGILAQEIAALRPVKQVILISSIQSDKELPLHLKVMRSVPLYYLSKGNWRIQTLPYWGRLFGIHGKAEQELIMDMFSKHSDSYRIWAIRQLLNWVPKSFQAPLIHFHGTQDRIFPIDHIASCIPIEGGDHFMVYRKAREVEKRINECLI